MGLNNKIKKVFSFVRRYDVMKCLYWRWRLHLPRSASFHVCPKSIVEIDRTASVCFEAGEFSINDSWFATRKRRYVSDFRLDKNSTFVCEGDFKLFKVLQFMLLWVQSWSRTEDGLFLIPILP